MKVLSLMSAGLDYEALSTCFLVEDEFSQEDFDALRKEWMNTCFEYKKVGKHMTKDLYPTKSFLAFLMDRLQWVEHLQGDDHTWVKKLSPKGQLQATKQW